MNLNSEILTIDEAAKYLRISRKHLANILKGVPPLAFVRAGRRILIRRTDLDEWYLEASQRRAPPTEQPPRRYRAARSSEALRILNVGTIDAPRNPGCASGECI